MPESSEDHPRPHSHLPGLSRNALSFESPDIYFSFTHSDSLGRAAALLGPVHSGVVWDYRMGVARPRQGRAPVRLVHCSPHPRPST